MDEHWTQWVENNGQTRAACEPDNDNIGVLIGFRINGEGNVYAHAFRAERVVVLNADGTLTLPLAVAERFAGGPVTWHATSETTWTLKQPDLNIEQLDELGPPEHHELPEAPGGLDEDTRKLVERLRRHQ